MCAIYILIAGSYTLFLSIALVHGGDDGTSPSDATSQGRILLAFIWICALGGIAVEAMLPLWRHKPRFSLAMYLGMGWSCLVCMGDLVDALSYEALIDTVLEWQSAVCPEPG